MRISVAAIRSRDPNELHFSGKMLQEIAAQIAELVIDAERIDLTLGRIEQKLEVLETAFRWVPVPSETVVRGPKYRGAPHSKKRKRS